MPRSALAMNQAVFYPAGHLAYVLRTTASIVAGAFHLQLPVLGCGNVQKRRLMTLVRLETA
jgi:hypothetical protein